MLPRIENFEFLRQNEMLIPRIAELSGKYVSCTK